MYLNGGALHLLEIVFVRNYSGSIVYWVQVCNNRTIRLFEAVRGSTARPTKSLTYIHDFYNASCSTPSQSTHPLAMRSLMPVTPETDG